MKIRNALAAAAIAMTLVTVAGCAVGRGQQTAGAYVDDSAITASVKTRMLDNHGRRRHVDYRRNPERHRDAVGFREEPEGKDDRREHRAECRRREVRQERDHRPPVSLRLECATPDNTTKRRNL